MVRQMEQLRTVARQYGSTEQLGHKTLPKDASIRMRARLQQAKNKYTEPD